MLELDDGVGSEVDAGSTVEVLGIELEVPFPLTVSLLPPEGLGSAGELDNMGSGEETDDGTGEVLEGGS